MGQLAAWLGDKDESCGAALVGSTNIIIFGIIIIQHIVTLPKYGALNICCP